VSLRPGLRARKKEKTRRTLVDVAMRLFAEDGYAATTVEAICEEAEVAVSTFYAYFEGKEALAFPDEDERAAIVAGILGEPPSGEPLHVTLRRASLALVERDLKARNELAERYELIAREPALAASAARRQARHVEELAQLLATQMGVDPADDLRPRLAISAAFGALNAAWSAWAADTSRDLRELVDRAHDTLDTGFAESLTNIPAARPASSSGRTATR
jgi:AcrR family transcriptional regulator